MVPWVDFSLHPPFLRPCCWYCGVWSATGVRTRHIQEPSKQPITKIPNKKIPALCCLKSFRAMLWLRVLLGFLVLHFSTTDGTGELQYLLVVPSVLQSASPNTACVHLVNLNESLDLKVLLEYEGQNITILTEQVRKQNIFKCSTFNVPTASSSPLAFITISFKGNTVNGTERRTVAIQNTGSALFIQTDKPTYKPEEKVLFRVVALDTDFRPVPETVSIWMGGRISQNHYFRLLLFICKYKKEKVKNSAYTIHMYPLITIQDPQGNRIFQWLNVTSEVSIVQLSFQLISEPILGDYQIIVQKTSGAKTSHSLTVEEYGKYLHLLYTYGQPVEGRAQLSVCRNLNFYGSCKRDPLCVSVKEDLGKDGCLSHVFSSKTFELNRSGYWMNLDVKATITEKGTGIQMDKSDSILISRTVGTVKFENMDPNYKTGLQYCGQVKLLDVNDSPITDEIVQLLLNDKNIGNYSTSTNGTAQFCIDTSEILSPDFSLRLIYKPNENCNSDGWILPYYPEAYYSVQRFYSRTKSFVKIHQIFEDLPCGQTREIKVSYILNNIENNAEKIKQRKTATFFYFVLVKNKIVHFGEHTIRIHSASASTGSFNIRLAISPSTAPVATLVVYTLHPEKEVVADTARFQIEKCFKNQVRLEFSERQALPASNINFHIEAAANSHCALRALDQSVLLLRPEKELSAKSMFGYYFNGLSLEDDPKEPCIPADNIFYNGLFYVPADTSYGPDIYGLIRNTGVKFVTNSRLRQPVVCSRGWNYPHVRPSLEMSGRFPSATSVPSFEASPVPPPRGESGHEAIIETVRKFFPETWIWDLFPIKSIVLMQPIKIFDDDAPLCPVLVSLAESPDFQAHLLSPVGDDNGCVCSNERKTYIWKIISKKLGNVVFNVTAEAPRNSGTCGNGTSGGLDVGLKDTLIRTLLVEPEGIEREVSQSSFICTKEGTPISEPVSLKLPENLVEGSARASFSCIGQFVAGGVDDELSLSAYIIIALLESGLPTSVFILCYCSVNLGFN
ncbi:hypothetical protein JD844_010056 [Phrynosoma platyrhinos]|uniref:Alpha-2-macroglobulin bait region domain-containing protein n=1 Tax=Phrynosoma platyrhinos TaxID=52577 RepID=A0ABQ7TGQ9_PHRPL|nr:hypothetical protein JD844_010056 [Phrynosoma platyrhinos]